MATLEAMEATVSDGLSQAYKKILDVSHLVSEISQPGSEFHNMLSGVRDLQQISKSRQIIEPFRSWDIKLTV